MQTRIVAGDTLSFLTLAPAGYAPSAGWTLKHRLVPRGGSTEITLTATTEGADYRTTAAAATTATWAAGGYGWYSWVEQGSERHSLDSGQLDVAADPATLNGPVDSRSQAEIAIADLKVALATFTASSAHVAEYQIAGRMMRFASAVDIQGRIDFWKRELLIEQQKAAIAAGLADPRRMFVRFGRA